MLAVAAGAYHSLAVEGEGAVLAWGGNGNGQLGDGTLVARNSAVYIPNLDGVVAVAAGAAHSLAVKSDGTVSAWGGNSNGQLGDGGTTDRLSPVTVPGLTGVVAVSAGYAHTLAVKSDGTVLAWGNNDTGQLGDGSFTERHSPVAVSGLTGVVAVSAGNVHSLAVKSDGTVWAWGYNYTGELGDGSTTSHNSPVQVHGLSGMVAVSAGGVYSLAVKSDGTVWAWGYNSVGQLGDGSTTDRHSPVVVDDVFPSGGVMPAGWVATSGSSANWTVVAEPYAGTQSLKSGTVGNSAHSGIRYTGSFRDGYVTFQRKVSSQFNGDWLRFYVDGVLQGEWGWEQDWARVGTFVTAGTHEIAWEYEKNGSGASGSDAAWIDSVELPTAFADVPTTNFAFDYINAIKDAGITTGCGGSNYCPSQNVTREQMAAFIIRAVEGEPAACTTAPFLDVPLSSSFCKYIKRMLEKNITTGCTGGNYCPSQNVDRQQMAAFVIRAVEGNPAAGYCGSTAPFSDVPVSNTFCGHIKRMSELGITTGCGNGNYCPAQPVTRDQMAAFLARAFLGM